MIKTAMMGSLIKEKGSQRAGKSPPERKKKKKGERDSPHRATSG